jgi:hypothetical protein
MNHKSENAFTTKPKIMKDGRSKDTHPMMRTKTREAFSLEEKWISL